MTRLLGAERRDRSRVLQRASPMPVGWLFVACIVVICFDVVTRKFGFQVPAWARRRCRSSNGTCTPCCSASGWATPTCDNAHVRIDVFIAPPEPAPQAWLEIFGCLIFALPYCLVATYYAYVFTRCCRTCRTSRPTRRTGCRWRWIIKAFLFLGLRRCSLAAVLSVLLRCSCLSARPSWPRAPTRRRGARRTEKGAPMEWSIDHLALLMFFVLTS